GGRDGPAGVARFGVTTFLPDAVESLWKPPLLAIPQPRATAWSVHPTLPKRDTSTTTCVS
ncbi:MAG TPA: hypothetical protein VJK29_13300, partial [Terriglobales bacterium]|nr:hypothetical protein [Terriglobales bacterium]